MYLSEITVQDVKALVHSQYADNLNAANGHHVALKDAIIEPRRILLITRQVIDGQSKDELSTVWLVGQENEIDGYKIILRSDGSQFGLATNGFSHDKALVLAGWYSDLLAAFLGM